MLYGYRLRTCLPQADLRKLDEIIASCPGVGTICLDVANGYSEAFVATVKEVRAPCTEASCMCIASYCYWLLLWQTGTQHSSTEKQKNTRHTELLITEN